MIFQILFKKGEARIELSLAGKSRMDVMKTARLVMQHKVGNAWREWKLTDIWRVDPNDESLNSTQEGA